MVRVEAACFELVLTVVSVRSFLSAAWVSLGTSLIATIAAFFRPQENKAESLEMNRKAPSADQA
jgi:hypothetical protein